MQIKNKTVTVFIAIFLMTSMSASMMLIPNTNAHNPLWQIPTYAYISVMPNPIGVGQQMTCYVWLSNVYDNAAIGNNYRFQNYKVVITAPDGTQTTQNFAFIADSTSSQLFAVLYIEEPW